jgi:hypothetical protein
MHCTVRADTTARPVNTLAYATTPSLHQACSTSSMCTSSPLQPLHHSTQQAVLAEHKQQWQPIIVSSPPLASHAWGMLRYKRRQP